jgi:hypothetical protein
MQQTIQLIKPIQLMIIVKKLKIKKLKIKKLKIKKFRQTVL